MGEDEDEGWGEVANAGERWRDSGPSDNVSELYFKILCIACRSRVGLMIDGRFAWPLAYWIRNDCVTKNFDFKSYERKEKRKIDLCRTNHLSSCWICQSGRPRILRFFRSTDTQATIESPRFSTKQWPLNDLHWDSILFNCSHVLCMSRGGDRIRCYVIAFVVIM